MYNDLNQFTENLLTISYQCLSTGEDSMIVVTDQETLDEIENEVDVEENQSSETEDAEHSLVEAARNVLNLLRTLDQ